MSQLCTGNILKVLTLLIVSALKNHNDVPENLYIQYNVNNPIATSFMVISNKKRNLCELHIIIVVNIAKSCRIFIVGGMVT